MGDPFALLGGTSELCPLVPLLRLGAHVAVVAREGAKLEEAVSEAARSETGTLYVPLTETNSSNSGVSARRRPRARAGDSRVAGVGFRRRDATRRRRRVRVRGRRGARPRDFGVGPRARRFTQNPRAVARRGGVPVVAGDGVPDPRAAWRHAMGRERDAEANEGASTGGSWWASSAAAGSRQLPRAFGENARRYYRSKVV